MIFVFCLCSFVALSSVCIVYLAHVVSKGSLGSIGLDSKPTWNWRSIHDHYDMPLFVCDSSTLPGISYGFLPHGPSNSLGSSFPRALGGFQNFASEEPTNPWGTEVLHPSWGCGRFARCNVWPLQRSREKTNLQQSRDLLGVGLQQICMNGSWGNLFIILCSLGPPMSSKVFDLLRFSQGPATNEKQLYEFASGIG